ncbi:contractile injection system protein, VgrG/Pvc8 family [Spartinivicinus ruber]|uniref:contractile injection system protein, VgrG/Pvc8 family n=1 Tax=Spartinivicinus ruber TaxID=2683272 RepID=UPI0013D264B8|nr:contractile injection system protein, VgrG/Pvc8 family [Spartinivicinus ruber]
MLINYQITISSYPVIIQNHLISLELTDEAGIKSDSVTLKLSDPEGNLPIPAKGTKLSVAIQNIHMGDFIIDEVSLSGPPNQMTIQAKGANLRDQLRSPKSRSWHQKKLVDIVTTVANDNGLKPKIAEIFTPIVIDHIDQTEESDINFLSRIALDHGAIVKPMMEHLVFVERGKTKTATGRQLSPITITKVSKWNLKAPDRQYYKSVTAKHHSTEEGKTSHVKVGNGEPVYTIKMIYPTKEAAQVSAKAKLSGLNDTEASLSITVVGNPELIAERPVIIQGVRAGVDGRWVVKQTKHLVSASGYTTSVSLTK